MVYLKHHKTWEMLKLLQWKFARVEFIDHKKWKTKHARLCLARGTYILRVSAVLALTPSLPRSPSQTPTLIASSPCYSSTACCHWPALLSPQQHSVDCSPTVMNEWISPLWCPNHQRSAYVRVHWESFQVRLEVWQDGRTIVPEYVLHIA